MREVIWKEEVTMTGIEPVLSFSENLPDVSSLRRMCFTGVRGVGKSSVLKEIDGLFPSVSFTSGSDILQEIMGDLYSQFEYLPERKKYAYRLKIRDILAEIQQQKQKDLLVDSHLTVYNLKTGDIDVIYTHRDYGFYTDIILLDSNPKRILDHRQRDTKKKRIVDIDIIKQELEFERNKASEISNEHGIKLHVIQMGENAAQNLANIIAGISSN
jgi:adenylate kinase